MPKHNHSVLILCLFIFFSWISFAQKDELKITYKKNTDKSVDFLYTKNSPGSLYLRLKFTKSENFDDPKFRSVIDSYSGFLFTIDPLDKNKPISFNYKINTIRGIPNPKVDSSFAYVLPFKAGDSLTIRDSKNFKEKYIGKEKPETWRSFAIYRKEGDTVRSIRKGVVVNIGNKYDSDTTVKKEFSTKANRVIIEHSDGTLAYYFGFKKNSFLVKEGQTVYPQTPLGTLGLFNENEFVLVFYINYLTIEKKGSKAKISRTYVNPYFYTPNGDIQLENKKEYKVDFDESVFLKEFTKRERKKYKSNPEIFI